MSPLDDVGYASPKTAAELKNWQVEVLGIVQRLILEQEGHLRTHETRLSELRIIKKTSLDSKQAKKLDRTEALLASLVSAMDSGLKRLVRFRDVFLKSRVPIIMDLLEQTASSRTDAQSGGTPIDRAMEKNRRLLASDALKEVLDEYDAVATCIGDLLNGSRELAAHLNSLKKGF